MLHKIFGRECDAFYPPTRAILEGAYCEHSLQGTRWGASAGARDPHPDHAGIAGMKRAPRG